MRTVIAINLISFLLQLAVFHQTKSKFDIVLAAIFLYGIVFFYEKSIELWRRKFYFYLSVTTLLFSASILSIGWVDQNNAIMFAMAVILYIVASVAAAIKSKFF